MSPAMTVKMVRGHELQVQGATRVRTQGDFVILDNGDDDTPLALVRGSEVAYVVPLLAELAASAFIPTAA